MSKFNELKIKEIRRETPSSVSILFEIPENIKADYTFIPGQYLNIKSIIKGKEIRRAYSICSTPNSGELRIVVKKMENGTFSPFANSELKTGDTLEVGIPEGRFTININPHSQNNYIAFATGSGITPIISIIQSVLEQEPNSSFVLIYGNKDIEDTIFRNELKDLQQKYIHRLFIHFVFSRTKEQDSLFGRIDKSVVNFIINNKHKEKSFERYFLCGSEEMINSVSAILRERNIADDKILFEIFTPNNDNSTPIDAEGIAKITVLLEEEETVFEMSRKNILLDALLKEGIDAPYSCLAGACGNCTCRLLEGTVDMKNNYILTDRDIEEGLILACQSIVTSDEISIDFDDV